MGLVGKSSLASVEEGQRMTGVQRHLCAWGVYGSSIDCEIRGRFIRLGVRMELEELQSLVGRCEGLK